jgi:hypothetical protein
VIALAFFATPLGRAGHTGPRADQDQPVE